MKALSALVFAALAVTAHADTSAPSSISFESSAVLLKKLDGLVHLTPDQVPKAQTIFRQEEADVAAAQANDTGRPGAGGANFKIVNRTIVEIRALLTPDQLALYDRTRIDRGGGVTLPPPEMEVQMLDHEIGLSPQQRPVALQVYKEEYDAIIALPWNQRETGGAKYVKAAKDEISALLTPQQIERRDGLRAAQQTRASEEGDAAQDAIRASTKLVAKIGDIVDVENGPRRARMANGNRSGQAQFKVNGSKASETVIVSWERVPITAPVKITKIANTEGEIFGP